MTHKTPGEYEGESGSWVPFVTPSLDVFPRGSAFIREKKKKR